MNNAHRVRQRIQQIAGIGPNDSPLKVYVGIVLTDDECSTTYKDIVGRDKCFDSNNLVVAVKLINDYGNPNDYGKDMIQDLGEDGHVSLETKASPNIFPSVRLMCDVEDGPFTIPKQGSTILIGYSKWIEPFILLYSAVGYYNNSSLSDDNLDAVRNLTNTNGILNLVTQNDSNGIAISGSETRQQKDVINYWVTDSMGLTYSSDGSFIPDVTPSTVTAATQYYQDKDKIELLAGANGGPSYTTLYSQDKDNIRLTVSQKFDVLQSGTSNTLSDIITKLNTNLQNLNNTLTDMNNLNVTFFTTASAFTGPLSPVASAAASWIGGNGTITSDISTIMSNLSSLSGEISSLLG